MTKGIYNISVINIIKNPMKREENAFHSHFHMLASLKISFVKTIKKYKENNVAIVTIYELTFKYLKVFEISAENIEGTKIRW